MLINPESREREDIKADTCVEEKLSLETINTALNADTHWPTRS